MALVAGTVGFATLGVWLARNSGGAEWFSAWLLALGCLIALNLANARGNRGLAVALLLAFGLLTGPSVATTVNYYAATDPTAVRQAFGATALFVGALVSGGYAVRRDLSLLYRILFWLLLALIASGIVLVFVRIQAAYAIWALLGLAVFALYTIVDFNRLRRAGRRKPSRSLQGSSLTSSTFSCCSCACSGARLDIRARCHSSRAHAVLCLR